MPILNFFILLNSQKYMKRVKELTEASTEYLPTKVNKSLANHFKKMKISYKLSINDGFTTTISILCS